MLFVGADLADYLSVCVLNGLLSRQDVEVLDYPEAQFLYKENRELLSSNIRGKAFTLFFLNSYETKNRFHISISDPSAFDLVIVGDIQNNFGFFTQMLPRLPKSKTIILDGSDTEDMYPCHGLYWRNPAYWFLPRAHKRFRYFKRELTPNSTRSLYFKLVPRRLAKFLPIPKTVSPISFAIPDCKLVDKLPPKTQDFATHIVDEEVRKKLNRASSNYAFETEEEYYRDLQQSKFGVTTKRSGWDCLRHYEIAANGAVICFRDLDSKPSTCAPHGLVDGTNCISYRSFDELIHKTQKLSASAYSGLQENCFEWARKNCCSLLAERLLQCV